MPRRCFNFDYDFGDIVWHRISGCRGVVVAFRITGKEDLITYAVVWDDRATDWHYAIELTDRWADSSPAASDDSADESTPTKPSDD